MGRKSTRPNALPHLRARKKGSRTWYYYDHGIQPDGSRPETALGSDYLQAVRRWAELEASDAPATTVADLLDAWAKVAYLQLAAKTVKVYLAAVRRLKAFFGKPFPAPLEDVEPGHVGPRRIEARPGVGRCPPRAVAAGSEEHEQADEHGGLLHGL